MSEARLSGLRVIVTRDARDSEAWCQRLRAHGAEAVAFPCITCEDRCEPSVDAEWVRATAVPGWWLYTSPRAVESMARRFGGGLPVTMRCIAGGPRTAEALHRAAATPEFVGAGRGAVDAACAWHDARRSEGAGAQNVTLSWPGSDRVDRDVIEAMGARGVEVRPWAVYTTRPCRLPEGESRVQLNGDVIWVASPSAVAGLVATAHVGSRPLVSIGPRTTRAVKEHGLQLGSEARGPTWAAMVEATMEAAT